MLNYVLEGEFSPPTYKDVYLLWKATNKHGRILVTCSGGAKLNWYSAMEAKKMWQSYNLPPNAQIVTEETFRQMNFEVETLVGIVESPNSSGCNFCANELRMRNKYGITNFSEIQMDPTHKRFIGMNSVQACGYAQNLDIINLSRTVSPLTLTFMLERILGVKNIIIVVGRPGTGKSFLCKTLLKLYPDEFHYLDTDEYNKEIRPMFNATLPVKDRYNPRIMLQSLKMLAYNIGQKEGLRNSLKNVHQEYKKTLDKAVYIEFAKNNPSQLVKSIKETWVNILTQELRKVPQDTNLLVEIPYAMRKEYFFFKYLGGKILYISNNDVDELKKRNEGRGTKFIVPFIEIIPDRTSTRDVCQKEHLLMLNIDTSGKIADIIEERAKEFYENLTKNKPFCFY